MDIKNYVFKSVCLLLVLGFGYLCLSTFKNNGYYVSTNGLSERHVVSDSASWIIRIENESNSLKEAQEKLKQDKFVVLNYLKKTGFKDSEIERGSVSLKDQWEYHREEDKPRFKLSEYVIVKSQDLDLIRNARLQISELLEQNIMLFDNIEFYYKDLSKLRLEMICDATRDSLNRAKKIAESANTKIVGIRNLSVGNFSIVAEDTSGTADRDWDEGKYSVHKKVRVVVRGTFNIR